MPHAHDKEFSPDEDAALAIEALAEGDVGHAFHHACAALAQAPLEPRYEAIVEQVLARADDPAKLVALEPNVWFGKAAVRALWLAKRGDLAEALQLILGVAEARPDLPYLAWARRWLTQGGVAKVVDRDLAVNLASKLLRIVRQPERELDDEAAILAVLRELHPSLGIVHYATSALARKRGAFDEGVKHAERAVELEPSYMMQVALASARRDAKDLDGAITAFEAAIAIEPSDVYVRLDIGDLSLDLDRLENARDRYREVLALEPEQAWAKPSEMFARYRMGELGAREELVAYADANETNQRAADLAKLASPYERFLPAPTDASARLVDQLEVKGSEGTVKMTISSLEAPSVHLALVAAGGKATLEVACEEVQSPDPREPRAQVRHRLVRYEGATPRFVLPAPDPAVAEKIASIARQRFDIALWESLAAAVARELGPANAPHVLRAMVHPTPVAEGFYATYWVFRLQVAAALVLASIDGGWEGSLRRELLLDLARGPMDWTVTAAIVALARIGKEEPAARKELEDLFFDLLRNVPRPGHCCYEHALAAAWQWLPAEGDELRKVLLERQLACER